MNPTDQHQHEHPQPRPGRPLALRWARLRTAVRALLHPPGARS